MSVTPVGWYCANCGAYVDLNKSHTCPTSNAPTGASYDVVTVQPDWKRIVTLLEKAVDLLTKIEAGLRYK